MKPNLRIGIADKILAGLAIIILVNAISAIILVMTFDRVSKTFDTFSNRSLPSLISTSLLVRESEKLEANTPDVLIAENQFIRKSLAGEIAAGSDQWQHLVQDIQESSEAPLELSHLVSQAERLHTNIVDLIEISNKRIEISQRTGLITKRLRRVGEKINDYVSQPEGVPDKQSLAWQKWIKCVNQALITLLTAHVIDNIADLERLEESFQKLTDESLTSLQSMPDVLSQKAWPIQREVIKYGTGKKGLFSLVAQRLALKDGIDDTLFQNKFLSSKIVQSANSIFSTIKNSISGRWHELDQQLHSASRLMIAIPLFGILSTIIIFTYLRRSVIGRVLTLNEYMLAQVHGREAVLPAGGHDEVGVMTASVNYFVSEINHREEKLRESEEKYRNLFNTAPVGICRINIPGTNVFAANNALIEIFEFEHQDEFLRDFTMEKYFPEQGAFWGYLTDLKSEGRLENYEVLALTRNGRKKHLALSGIIYPLRDCVEFAVTDVTRQKEAEKALKEYQVDLERRVESRTAELAERNEKLRREIFERIKVEKALKESEGRFRILAENLKEVLILVDATSGRVIYANSAFETVFGRDIESLYENIQSVLDCIHPEDRDRLTAFAKKTWRTADFDDVQIEYRIINPQKEERWLVSRAVSVINEAGEIYRITIMTEDITNQRNIEQVLRESEENLRYLSNRLIDAQEDERRKLAAELHDDIGPSLASLKFGVERVIDNLSPRKDHDSIITLKTVVNMVKTLASQLGRIQMKLRPPTLDDLGIIETLDWFCNEYRNVYTHIEIKQNIAIDENEIPKNLKVVIFRIIQEALNNVARHSQADRVSVALKRAEGSILLEILDNGQGFDVTSKTRERRTRGGLGLHSMRERVELSFGNLFLESHAGAGTCLRAQWKLAQTRDRPHAPAR